MYIRDETTLHTDIFSENRKLFASSCDVAEFFTLRNDFSVQLLSEEYSAMSPGTLEAHGLINPTEYEKVAALTKSASPDAHKKIAGQSFF